MKRLIIGFCVIALFLFIGAACANQSTNVTTIPVPATAIPQQDIKPDIPGEPVKPSPALPPGITVNVDDLMKNPEQYIGSIRVIGVVSSVSPEQRTIGLIDSREFASCGVTTCSEFILPVQWVGAMPRIEDTVQIVGEVQRSNGKFIFVAQSIEILDNKQATQNEYK